MATATEPSYRGATRPVTGLFADPRTTDVSETRTLPPPPPSPYAWDGRSVVLINLETGARTDLGVGHLGLGQAFDRSSTRFTWLGGPATTATAPAPVHVMDVASGAQRTYESGFAANLLADGRIAVSGGANPTGELFDLATGRDLGPWNDTSYLRMSFAELGMTIEREPFGPDANPAGWRFVVVPRDGNPAITLRAASVFPDWAHPGFVLALIPGTANYNLFLIDVNTADARFVATVHVRGSFVPYVLVSPAAGDFALAMSDGLCGGDPRLLLYDMTSGVVTALKTPFMPSAALGRGLGLEGFPLSARLDVNLETLSYLHVLPAPGAWSPDGKWAVIGPSSFSGFDPCAAGTGAP